MQKVSSSRTACISPPLLIQHELADAETYDKGQGTQLYGEYWSLLYSEKELWATCMYVFCIRKQCDSVKSAICKCKIAFYDVWKAL